MEIRAEIVEDYFAIAAVHRAAFTEQAGVASIVALLRQRKEFDPELSLVAELKGQVVGHVLFSPHRVQVLGQTVQVVNLAPLGIYPAYQKQGIGGRLIEAGHDLARRKGYAFSFLLGHPSYYPRFGYLQDAYGAASLKLSVADLALSGPELFVRQVSGSDVAALYALWQTNEKAVDFALDPGQILLDWISPDPAIESVVFTIKNGEPVGYARYAKSEPAKPRVFLARDSAVAQQMAHQLATKIEATEVDLPLHPNSDLAQALGEAECKAWKAAMVCPLFPGPFDEYYTQVQAGQRWPGRVIWPTAFDLG